MQKLSITHGLTLSAKISQNRLFRSNAPRSRAYRLSCSAAKDAGRLLRDAMQQPKQGSNLALLAAGNYLRSLGIEANPDITRILDILTNKNSLFGTRGGRQPINPYARNITVEEMQNVVEFFKSKGLEEKTVVGIILDFPQVLSYSVTDRLQPFFEYLVTAVGLTEAAVCDVVKHRPVVLGLERESLERLVGYLVANGSSMEEVVELLKTTL